MILKALFGLAILAASACTFQSAESLPTPSPLPPMPTEITGLIRIDPGTPTALPPLEDSSATSQDRTGVICRVANANRVSNVAVRRQPDTNAELFYAIQPNYTASVLEVRQVPGSLPWFFVRVDDPIETDLEVVEGWIRSDTVMQRTPCN